MGTSIIVITLIFGLLGLDGKRLTNQAVQVFVIQGHYGNLTFCQLALGSGIGLCLYRIT